MPVVIIVLNSLVSEGTPHMAYDMCRVWLAQGIRPVLLVLDDSIDEMRADFSALKVEIVSADLGNSRLGRFPRLILATRKLVKRTGAQGVISMLFGWHAFIAMGARSAGAPTLAHVGNHPGSLSASGLRKMRILVAAGRPFTSRLVCCSEYVRDAIIDILGVSRGVTCVVYNGVDLQHFAPTAGAPSGHGMPVLSMVARLESSKDHATLIEAAAILKARGRPCEIRLVGDGSRADDLKQLADALNVGDLVKFCGFRSDIDAVLAESDAFAFSVLPDEGLGIALIEAMVARVPIVASDVGACRETLADGRCGLLVKAADAEAMANGVMHLLDDRSATAQRVEAAEQRARDVFDATAMAKSYLALLS